MPEITDANELTEISKLKQAQLAIKEVKSLDEIKRLVDQSEALKGYAKAQQLSKEILDDITEYNLYATRQLGVISAGLPKAKSVRQNSEYQTAVIGVPKSEALSLAGIDIRRANEAEKLAELPETKFIKVIADKKAKDELTKTAVIKEIQNINRETKRQGIPIYQPSAFNGKYDVIYADPPWQHEFSDRGNRVAENHYPLMPLEDIKSLKIPADDNSVLLLWSTAPILEKAFQVIMAWGFSYRTCAVWDKEKIGTGFWFRGQHELLLVGVKGSFRAPEAKNRVSSVYRETRRQHSVKPDFYYEMIERMFPDRRYLELFARRKYSEKWDVWGNQV